MTILTFTYFRRGALALQLLAVASLAFAVPAVAQTATAADSIVQRQRARWDSVRAGVLPAVQRICGTKSSPGYLCGSGSARDLLVSITASGSADTLRAAVVVPPPDTSVVVTPPTDTARDSVIVTPGPGPGPVLFTHPFAPPSNGALLAELPRDTVRVEYPAITRRYLCTNLQACLDTAKSGDEIRLAQGATFTGTFVVKPTARASWQTVRTDVTDAELGGPWERMTPTKAASLNLATIRTATSDPAILVTSGAHHVRFVGVRVRTTAPQTGSLVTIGQSETDRAQIPHHVTLDRVVIDGGASDVRRCVRADGWAEAIVSSSLVNCHSRLGDAQGVLAINTPGPIRLENNSIQGSHQSVMFGGGDPAIAGLLPSDAVIRRNDLTRPAGWFWSGGLNADGTHAYPGDEWPGKTNVELKLAARVLVEGNVVGHTIKDQQAGSAFNLKSGNQSGACTWCATSDVTVRYNRIVGAALGFQLSKQDDRPAIPATRITVYGNVADSIGVGPYKGDTGDALQLNGVSDVVFQDNWVRNPTGRSCLYAVDVSARFVGRGLVCGGQYGIRGESGLSYALPGALLTNNVVEAWGTAFGSWPSVPVNATRDAMLSGVAP